ncbi:Protein HEATR9 [Varanus komodoensis]|nr:Protein HEATR9 [Varanus komodoensis]
MGWMRANKLKLNPDKTKVLLVGGLDLGMGDLGLVLNGVALPLRDRVHSLGVLLDPELSLEAQVMAVARSAFLQLRLIHQLRPFLENDCLARVTHTLVTSRLDFCNALYVGLPLKKVRILQLVQNRAARLLMGTGRCSPITPVLLQLHWLLIQARKAIQFKMPRDSFHQKPCITYPRSPSEWRTHTPEPHLIQPRIVEQPDAASLEKQCIYRKKLEKEKSKTRKKKSDFLLSKFVQSSPTKQKETYMWEEKLKPERLKILIKYLSSPVELEQLYAAQALGKLGFAEESVLSALRNAECNSLPLQYEVARSLALLGCLETSVMKVLIRHLKVVSLNRREDTLAALKVALQAWSRMPTFEGYCIGARSSLIRNLQRLVDLQQPEDDTSFSAALCLGYLDKSSRIAQVVMFMSLTQNDWQKKDQHWVGKLWAETWCGEHCLDFAVSATMRGTWSEYLRELYCFIKQHNVHAEWFGTSRGDLRSFKQAVYRELLEVAYFRPQVVKNVRRENLSRYLREQTYPIEYFHDRRVPFRLWDIRWRLYHQVYDLQGTRPWLPERAQACPRLQCKSGAVASGTAQKETVRHFVSDCPAARATWKVVSEALDWPDLGSQDWESVVSGTEPTPPLKGPRRRVPRKRRWRETTAPKTYWTVPWSTIRLINLYVLLALSLQRHREMKTQKLPAKITISMKKTRPSSSLAPSLTVQSPTHQSKTADVEKYPKELQNDTFEVLNRNIRGDMEIKGASIRDESYKLRAFADDLVFILEEPLPTMSKLLQKIEEYGEVTGMKINREKTKLLALVMLVKQMGIMDAVVIRRILDQLQRSPMYEHRVDAAKLLATIGLETIQQEGMEEDVFNMLLMKLSNEPLLVVRQSVVLAVEELRMKKRVWDIVEKQLKDDRDEIRKQAVIALGVLGIRHKGVFFALLEMLELDSSEDVRVQVIRAFSSLGMNNVYVRKSLRNKEQMEGILARESARALKILDKIADAQKALRLQSYRVH